jgi:hypothetical protein
MKVQNIFCILIGIVLVLTVFSVTALAGRGSSNGEVTRLMVHNPGIVMFNAGSHPNKPGCNTAGNEWAFKLDTSRGRSMYALLLTAVNQGIPVHVYGTGQCSAWGDREDVYWMYLDP